MDETSYYYLLNEIAKYCLTNNNNSERKKEEKIGYQIGYKLTNKLADDPTIKLWDNNSDVINYIGKKLWPLIFNSNPTNIKFNSTKNICRLTDHNFYFYRTSFYRSFAETFTETGEGKELMRVYLRLFCSIIRGAINGSGYQVEVTANFRNRPKCTFLIKFI